MRVVWSTVSGDERLTAIAPANTGETTTRVVLDVAAGAGDRRLAASAARAVQGLTETRSCE